MTSPVLAEVRRGPAVESVHRGAVVVVNARGQVLSSCGDPGLRSFARSSIKPLQALPLVAGGGVEHFGLTAAELAVACGSHSGEAFHVDAVLSILRKVDLSEDALQCGGHFPFHQPTAEAMRLRGEAPRPVYDNCSGKHAGMLALARLQGWDPEGYLAPEHPVQRRIAEALEAAAGNPTAVATSAVDGCGVPTYYMSLLELATAFARLADPELMPEPWRAAASVVSSAMMRHPEMVAGTGRFDTDLMRLAGGRVFSKGGGEAVMGAGVPGRRIGLAAKIEDGGPRALAAVATEALRQSEILSADDLAALSAYARPAIRNRGGLTVGEIRAVFTLR